MIIFYYLGLGSVAGLLAGLFGIGGGIIIVPALIVAFSWQGLSDQVLTHMAIATSLATIVVTGFSSVLEHQRQQAVQWPIVYFLVLGICIGAGVGVKVAIQLEGSVLQLLIGVFAILVALHMWFKLAPAKHRVLPNKLILSLVGMIIGFASALFGIGGGTITVPFLSWCKVRMQQAVATAAACGIPIALCGSLFFIYFGWQNPNLPEWSTGFVYWPAWLGIVVSSIIAAKYGAKLAHRLPENRLKQVFAIMLIIVGIKFIIGSI